MKTSLFLFALVSSAVAAIPGASADPVPQSLSAPIGWKTAEPADTFARGEWWRLFGDATLDQLETRALAANQDLRAAAARVEQARAAAGFARSNYWPQIAANGSATRERTSRTTDNVFPDQLTTTDRAPLSVAWELDLFGRVRHLSTSARADAEASAATFETVRLALTAEVATSYFSLRALDQELTLLRDTASLRARTRDLIRTRLTSGAAAEVDLVRAETELAIAESESAALGGRRAAQQNALAVLVGEPAGSFSLELPPASAAPLTIPADLPSELLERRPDVAAAERALAAANERIGVAKAAFFPAISLTGAAGYASGDVDRLFNAGSRIWSIGPSLYLPIFQGGRNRANLERSRGAYDEAVAAYRQRVLVAFREVQDALTATHFLAEQSAAQERALTAAHRATTLAQVRYDAGYVSQLELIDAQRTALAIERATVQLAAQRLNTSVALVKSLGGGWRRPALVAQR